MNLVFRRCLIFLVLQCFNPCSAEFVFKIFRNACIYQLVSFLDSEMVQQVVEILPGAVIERPLYPTCRQTSNISRTLVGNKIVDNSDVVGASPVGAAPTTSSFST